MARDIPVIFSAPMVLALLAGRKTMTRRLAWRPGGPPGSPKFYYGKPTPWQNVKPGDRLWVRENLSQGGDSSVSWRWRYAADGHSVSLDRGHPSVPAMIAWAHHKEQDYCPSIHMPRWASRLTLIVTATKIEPVQNITEADATAEGIPPRGPEHPYGLGGKEFGDLWSRLHGAESWEQNPEVVALAFSVVKANIDEPAARAA